MVYKIGVQNVNNTYKMPSFGKDSEKKKSECENKDTILTNHCSGKIAAEKLVNAFTKYPAKGLKGSKNANFYEFLTMGTVPYLVGSAALISVFTAASHFFKTPDSSAAMKVGKKMALGVLGYGLAKNASKKLIEAPVKAKFGIDVNMPYKKVIYELPEDNNKTDLVSHEYHKVFESVDFPRWDLLYDNEKFGEERNAYFDKIAKKMHLDKNGLDHSDQKVKPKIREKIVQTKLFSTLSSYLWAGTAVGVAMQSPWENLELIKTHGVKDVIQNAQNIGKTFVKSCKYFVQGKVDIEGTPKILKQNKIAGLGLLGAAIGMTLLGNFVTLKNVNKDKGADKHASAPIIDNSREKVVC